MTRNELLKARTKLEDARASGVRRVRDQNGEEIEYRSDTEMAAALRALDAALARPKPNTIVFRTTRGLSR